MGRAVKTPQIPAEERKELERRVSAHTTNKRDHDRARIVLLAGSGMKQHEVKDALGVSISSVSKWLQRYELYGLEGLNDKPRPGRPGRLEPEKTNEVITKVTQPPSGRNRWSVRTMAEATGVSRSSVHRLWQQNDLKPHRVRTFKLSNDRDFERKFWDVIGLYLDPPTKALVLCCDEKGQCQALQRTQPGLPLGVGEIRTQTHDYKRHGTAVLFAAMNYLEGKLIHRVEQRHTHVEWLRFLKQIDRETPSELDIHLILDNYCTHKQKDVKAWLAKHPRFHLHFTPTGASWMNLVERFFADLTQDVLLNGSFSSVRELINDIEAYLAERNLNPKPYRWKAKGEEILRKIQRARATLEAQEGNT